jgi:hypothetical protein
MDLTDTYRTIHSRAAAYTFLSALGAFSQTAHTIGHKTKQNKCFKN